MPIYQYRCSLCGQEQEVLQKVSEPPLTECPSCGKPGMQKLLTAAGFQLKGSGWYATDFKGGAKKPDDKKKVDEKKPAEKPAETKTEPTTKTETKSEAAA